MQKFKSLIASFVTLISLLALTPMAAHAEWRSNDSGWWYTEGISWATNWRLINKKWYYFYGNGYMAHDNTINGYNVNSNGEWVQQLPVITNNTNVVATKSTDNIVKTDLNNNTYKQDNKIVKEDDETTIKRFFKEKDHIRLRTKNDAMNPILVDDCKILGKLVGRFRSFK